MQAYSNNILYAEIDYLTPLACKREVLRIFNPVSSDKSVLTAACSPETIGPGLPVISTMTNPQAGVVVHMRFASIQVCEEFVRGVANSEIKIDCGASGR